MRSETREELANYLLNHCFIIGNLESTREKYYLLTNNEEEMQEIFRPLGYSIVINRNSHRPNISSVISGYKQPSKSVQSIEITGFIEKSKPPEIIFFYTLLPLTA